MKKVAIAVISVQLKMLASNRRVRLQSKRRRRRGRRKRGRRKRGRRGRKTCCKGERARRKKHRTLKTL